MIEDSEDLKKIKNKINELFISENLREFEAVSVMLSLIIAICKKREMPNDIFKEIMDEGFESYSGIDQD